MTALPRLNRVYIDLLASFHEHGGVGSLDMHHRLKVGNAPLQGGDPGSCMLLVSRGYLAGENGSIMLTELGREAAEAELASRQERV